MAGGLEARRREGARLSVRVVLDTNVFVSAVFVSGDKDLVDHDGWRGIRVLRPRQFVDELLFDR